MRREGHKTLSFVEKQSSKISNAINKEQFYHLNEDPAVDYCELETEKDRIRLNVPIHVGFYVLSYGKLLLLEFIYDFLALYIDHRDYQICQGDTDSLYLSFSGRDMFTLVPPAKRKAFATDYPKRFAVDYCPAHETRYFDAVFQGELWEPEACCEAVAKYDIRTPGKFHREFIGTGIIALSPKCYYCIGPESKQSHKGISKRLNPFTSDDYKRILTERTTAQGTNRGFRIKGDDIFTYTQSKRGLNYLYTKRVVGKDGTTTFPSAL